MNFRLDCKKPNYKKRRKKFLKFVAFEENFEIDLQF